MHRQRHTGHAIAILRAKVQCQPPCPLHRLHRIDHKVHHDLLNLTGVRAHWRHLVQIAMHLDPAPADEVIDQHETVLHQGPQRNIMFTIRKLGWRGELEQFADDDLDP